MPIQYRIGDATKFERINPTATVIIPHCCNDLGGWGAGFVLALSRRWKEPESVYRSRSEYKLGEVDLCLVENEDGVFTWVANIIGQHGYGRKGGPYVRYDALKRGLVNAINFFTSLDDNIEIHAPRLGCGLAGGDWNIVEGFFKEILEKRDFDVVIYDLP